MFFQYLKNKMDLKEKAELEAAQRVTNVINEIGFEVIREQSDKLGSDWVTYKLGDVVLRRDYVEQENPTGTADNPIEWNENVQLIPNAFYVYNGERKVWTGEPGTGAAWDDPAWEPF